ncbi:MAG: xanthine dehydrogenase family protein molybdopterin-binding subunit [Betaproteobacteria bacterium]|nr:xanthine dehydrogenase family protein molybdopterin-binding subunit [Betaproteobacteria bacterium]
MTHMPTSRRQFLKSAGALTLSFGIPLMDVHSQSAVAQDKPRLAGDLQIHRKLNAWIRIDSATQMVELRIGKVELGQGILTAVAQVCADELDVDFAKIKLISGDTALVPDEGVTAGSFSMPYCATAVQAASAEVRAILLGLAENKLNQPAAQLKVQNGVIRSGNGAQISYWELVIGESLNREATGLVKPKLISEHRYIGRSVPRPDIQAKVLGEAIFVQELRPKGMLFGKKQTRANSASANTPVARVVEAQYYRPYHMHGSIGTSAAMATLGADGVLTVQTHSQSVFQTGEAIAKMLGLPLNKVRMQHTQGSGCYGHNMADDAAADAALLAMQVPGQPVRLQYSREQEHAWEPYGSAMVMKTKASLDAQGNVLDWDYTLWSTPHGTRPSGQPGNLLSAAYLEKPFAMPKPVNGGGPNYAADRNAIALYDFPGHNVTTHFITEMPLRVSSTRGLGAYANIFAIESFIDELAHATGADPVDYRLRFLKDERARDVIVKAAEKFAWSQWRKTPGRGRGIGFAKYKNIAGYCAVALEVEVNRQNGRIRVLRAVASADCGHMVNPDGVSNQIEGGLIQSLSWTLKEEVQMDKTRVLSRDWNSYPILTFSEVPPVDIVLIDRPGQPFLGTGEASQGPTGAALANAVFDATGVRLRTLPLTPDRVLQAL